MGFVDSVGRTQVVTTTPMIDMDHMITADCMITAWGGAVPGAVHVVGGIESVSPGMVHVDVRMVVH
jgi:hypothetical protein